MITNNIKWKWNIKDENLWKNISFREKESKCKTWQDKNRSRQDCYNKRINFIETTKRWRENNVDKYDKHAFIFDWILWDT
jgi:hypothetical protein